MLEYLNYGAVGVITILFMIVLVMTFLSKGKGKGFYALFAIAYAFLFYEAYDKYESAQTNMSAFKNTEVLRCFSGGGLYSAGNEYKVSKKEGWSVDKNYFINKSIIVEVSQCKPW